VINVEPCPRLLCNSGQESDHSGRVLMSAAGADARLSTPFRSSDAAHINHQPRQASLKL